MDIEHLRISSLGLEFVVFRALVFSVAVPQGLRVYRSSAGHVWIQLVVEAPKILHSNSILAGSSMLQRATHHASYADPIS